MHYFIFPPRNQKYLEFTICETVPPNIKYHEGRLPQGTEVRFALIDNLFISCT